jgi:formate dehydrogenase subunit gamma
VPQQWDESEARGIIAAYQNVDGPLLPILHALQETFGAIPDAATALIAQELNLSRAEVHGVISFYHDFRRTRPGRRLVKICRAEACQSMGGNGVAKAVLAELGIGWGETTEDGAATVMGVYCLGLCAAAPAAHIDDVPYARLSAERLIAAVRKPS